jgi:glycerophosphoryl diester phosphodiesterase
MAVTEVPCLKEEFLMDMNETPDDFDVRSVVFVAHRGNVPGYPENTMAAFTEAAKSGIALIELDLRGTRDGQIVVIHDATLDRTTNGKGRVADFTLEELKRLDAGQGEKIPAFEEVLQLLSGTAVKLLLDIKEGPGLDKKKVVGMIENRNALLNVIVGPRSIADLQTFKALNPNLRTLGFIPGIDDIDPFVVAGIDIIRLWSKWVDANPQLIVKCHELNRPVWVMTQDFTRTEFEKLIKYGVDGIISDPSDAHSLFGDGPFGRICRGDLHLCGAGAEVELKTRCQRLQKNTSDFRLMPFAYPK